MPCGPRPRPPTRPLSTMIRPLGLVAFVLGLAALGWVGAGYAGVNPFALAMTLLIGACYLAGGLELLRYQRATAGLQVALAGVPASGVPELGAWLGQLDATLRQPVRQRIEGERQALPGPVMTPFLVGLLVLLGMLGTFLGMVATLKGAVLALDSTTDLPSIRAALSAPVQGLGVAFGTSVAGVAASAMLGLVAALCRRDRQQAAQALDGLIATRLRVHTQAWQRERQGEALLASVQAQAVELPEAVARVVAPLVTQLVTQLQATMVQMTRQHEVLAEGLLAGQAGFHAQAQAAYAGLARSVEQSLKTSLTEAAQAAGAVIQPAVQSAVAGIAQETSRFHHQLADSVQVQLDGVSTRFDGTVQAVTSRWTQALDQQQTQADALAGQLHHTLDGVAGRLTHTLEALVGQVGDQSKALLQTVDQAHARLHGDAAEREAQRLAAWSQALDAMGASLQHGWQQAGARAEVQQAAICERLAQTARDLQAHADTQARATLGEVSRLIDTASQAPRAAAELIGQLREQLSDSLARDNGMLEERVRLMATLGTLLEVVNRAATEQRSAVDALVATSAGMLERAGAEFGERLSAEAERMASAATQLGGSAVEVASLGEAFGVAVQLFSQSSEALTAQLQRIEAALAQSSARSDEQLGYYVAQARELIDLSISSQKQIVDDLQRIAERPQPVAGALA
jgi:Domain of unknown function (DUF802)